jgi:hypothetical protein
MKTEITNIADINTYITEPIKAKENLATNIISLMGPMVDETIRERKDKFTKNNRQLKMIVNNIEEMKDQLQELINKHKFLTLKKSLIDIIEKLISSGLIYQSTLTVEVKQILMNINKLKSQEIITNYKKLSLILDKENKDN